MNITRTKNVITENKNTRRTIMKNEIKLPYRRARQIVEREYDRGTDEEREELHRHYQVDNREDAIQKIMDEVKLIVKEPEVG